MLKQGIRVALGLVSGAALAFPVQAQEQARLEEITVQGSMGRYSALKSDVPIMETARSVSIETQFDILNKGALSLADAYVYSAGVYGEQFGFATRGDWLSVRGLSVPEYRDSLQALFGNYNNTRPDIYTIEQVEVLKGPASVLYGQGSPGGIVNVVSKAPREDSPREIVLEAGNFERAQLAADWGGALDAEGRWLWRMNAVYRDTGTQVDEVDEQAWVFAPSLSWRPTEQTNLTLLLNLQEVETDVGEQFLPVVGTLLPGPDGRRIAWDAYHGEPDFNRYDTDSQSLTLLADHQLNEVWSVESTARVTRGESDYAQTWAAFLGGDRYVYNADGSLYGDGLVPRDWYVALGESEQVAMDSRLRARFQTGALQHELLIGVMYQDVTTETDLAYLSAVGYDFATGGPDATFGDRYWINVFNPRFTGSIPQSLIDANWFDAPESNTKDLGIYVNDQIDVGRWSLLAGLRYDEVETDNGGVKQNDYAASYSLGALYAFDNGISPYVSWAESFEPVIGVDNLTQEALKPREGEQLEAGVKFQPGDSGAFITLARYAIEISNLDNPNSQVGGNSQQEGVSDIRGTEVEVFLPLGDFTLELNASLVDSENPDGFRFASVPRKQASTWLNWRPMQQLAGFKAGLGLRYVGESWDGIDTLRTPSYSLADLMVGYETERWDATLNLRNLADKEYMATCLARGDCFLGENRTLVGRLRYHF